MKVAIVHDELLRKGGAERVVISIHKLFLDADIYTTAYNEKATFAYFKRCNIKVSFLNRFVRNERDLMRVFFPLGIVAFRLFDLRKYDLIIISSAHGAQYIRKPQSTICINYVHYLFRAVWEPYSYNFYKNPLVRFFSGPLLMVARIMDRKLSIKADHIFFNSEKTKRAYCSVFKPISFSLLPPPVPLSDFSIAKKTKGYFLVVSRLEPYKRVDLVIDVFNELSDYRLVVVGSGTLESELKLKAKYSNIEFRKNVGSGELRVLYSECEALIFPQVEDFGITPLECNASGRPVIAFAKGGILETMISIEESPTDGTSILFNEQTEEELKQAIVKYHKTTFSPFKIRENALKFSEEKFHLRLKQALSKIEFH